MYSNFIDCLGCMAIYGPPVYHALGLGNSLLTPSVIKHQNGPGTLLSTVDPDIHTKVEGLRKDILLYSHDGEPVALGTNFGPSAVILLPKEFLHNDDIQHALRFILKHEISHINTNDGFKASALASLCSLISTVSIPSIASWCPWWAACSTYSIPWFVGSTIYHLSMLRFEWKADDFACKHATDQEVIDGLEFCKGWRDSGKDLHVRLPAIFTPKGNVKMTIDPSHPPTTDRCMVIKMELRRRNISKHKTPSKTYEASKKLITSINEKKFKLKTD